MNTRLGARKAWGWGRVSGALSPQRWERYPVGLSGWCTWWRWLRQTLRWRDTLSASGWTAMTAGWWNCQSQSPPTWSHRRNHQVCWEKEKDRCWMRGGEREAILDQGRSRALVQLLLKARLYALFWCLFTHPPRQQGEVLPLASFKSLY